MEDGYHGEEEEVDRKPGTDPRSEMVGKVYIHIEAPMESNRNRRTVRSSPTWGEIESKHIHALFIILKLGRDRLVRSQGAK